MREITRHNDGYIDIFGVVSKKEYEMWKKGYYVYNINTYCMEKYTSDIKDILDNYEYTEYYTYSDWCDLGYYCGPYKNGIALHDENYMCE